MSRRTTAAVLGVAVFVAGSFLGAGTAWADKPDVPPGLATKPDQLPPGQAMKMEATDAPAPAAPAPAEDLGPVVTAPATAAIAPAPAESGAAGSAAAGPGDPPPSPGGPPAVVTAAPSFSLPTAPVAPLAEPPVMPTVAGIAVSATSRAPRSVEPDAASSPSGGEASHATADAAGAWSASDAMSQFAARAFGAPALAGSGGPLDAGSPQSIAMVVLLFAAVVLFLGLPRKFRPRAAPLLTGDGVQGVARFR